MIFIKVIEQSSSRVCYFKDLSSLVSSFPYAFGLKFKDVTAESMIEAFANISLDSRSFEFNGSSYVLSLETLYD